MDNYLLMNTQLSHAEAQNARPTSPAAKRHLAKSPFNSAIALSICMALQMTSYVMLSPLFARRFEQLGAGVEALGISAMAFALTATVMAPFLGALADRIGRRWIVLMSLFAYVLAFTSYYFAASATAFIILRGLAGALTAGLIPAVTGLVADLAPANHRAQWIGVVNGGASIGWIAGPILGGTLYDHWGFQTAALVSILMALAALILALFVTPETHRMKQPHQPASVESRTDPRVSSSRSGWAIFRSSLPGSLPPFILLLWIAFAVMFAWAFIEPRAQFYIYNDLGWTSGELGWVMSAYGLSLTLGEFFLGRLSDRWGRRPVILFGLVLFSAQFIGLALFKSFLGIAAAFLVAGFGNALYDPAVSASILDITSDRHRAQILGIKSTCASLGNILGPGLVVLFSSWLAPRLIFMAATGVVLVTIMAVLIGGVSQGIKKPSVHLKEEKEFEL